MNFRIYDKRSGCYFSPEKLSKVFKTADGRTFYYDCDNFGMLRRLDGDTETEYQSPIWDSEGGPVYENDIISFKLADGVVGGVGNVFFSNIGLSWSVRCADGAAYNLDQLAPTSVRVIANKRYGRTE